MTNMELVAAELEAAKKKHPKFVDLIFRELPQFDVVGFELQNARKQLQYRANAGFVDFETVLRCEVWEAIEAYVKGDIACARKELAQCAAVCVRAMEFVEKGMEETKCKSSDTFAN